MSRRADALTPAPPAGEGVAPSTREGARSREERAGGEGSREGSMQQTGRYAERLGRVRQMLAEQNLDGLLCYGNPYRKDYLRYVHPAPTPSPYGFCLLTRDGATLFVESPWDRLP